MTTLNIAILGGGSASTPQLISQFIQHEEALPIKKIYLVDILAGRERLSIIASFVRRMIEQENSNIEIMETLDRREALKQADFIINQIRVGGFDMRQIDETLCLEYGIIAEEASGPVGFMNALRTIPIMLDICEDIEELAPDAWLLNLTNPCSIITEAIDKHTNVKVIGINEGPMAFRNQFAKAYDVVKNDISMQLIGTSQLLWVTDLYVRGKSKLTDAILYKKLHSRKKRQDITVDTYFLQTYGVIGCDYQPYYYQGDQILTKQLDVFKQGVLPSDFELEEHKQLFSLYEHAKTATLPNGVEDRRGAAALEGVLEVIQAIHYNLKRILPVNIRNNGAIEGLRNDACVQVNSVVERHGIIPIQVPEILPHVHGLLQYMKAYESLTVEAGISKNIGVAIQAMTMHPFVPSAEVAHKLLQDMFIANEAYVQPVIY
ncbi:6-phospho-beta-glucosidase [Virgibacillus sp. Bac330]|uniref:family 4 glycosyl hydrolase n=1 Tax=Virgibacillus sp. Bac330 TaxID=2419841 RepID=UPI000EF4AE32|nr:6-phospho-beta-glucosidase [Virgibacillus sp. Bac330]